jgi:hypothetical protein
VLLLIFRGLLRVSAETTPRSEIVRSYDICVIMPKYIPKWLCFLSLCTFFSPLFPIVTYSENSMMFQNLWPSTHTLKLCWPSEFFPDALSVLPKLWNILCENNSFVSWKFQQLLAFEKSFPYPWSVCQKGYISSCY